MSPSDTQRFKDRLLNLREEMRSNVQSSIEAVIGSIHPVGEHAREPSEGLDRELAVERNEEQIYHAVNEALKRIEQGTFGRCVACGSAIPQVRLDAVPWTAYCVECERDVEEMMSRQPS